MSIDDAFCTDRITISAATVTRSGTSTFAVKELNVACRAEFIRDLDLLNLFKTQDGLVRLFFHRDVNIVIEDQITLDGDTYTVERLEKQKDLVGLHHLEVLAMRK